MTTATEGGPAGRFGAIALKKLGGSPIVVEKRYVGGRASAQTSGASWKAPLWSAP